MSTFIAILLLVHSIKQGATIIFEYKKTVRSEWIDYNDHMQDAYYGLVFSKAVDALQDEVGFDEAYRHRTGCTIYLVEERKFFLSEAKEGAQLEIEIHVLDVSEKLFHIYAMMKSDGRKVAISELMQLHVRQKPTAKGITIPLEIKTRLEKYLIEPQHQSDLKQRARAMLL
jgi:acyl-CoA thioester hydrolase